jgi:hypothetical protein
VQYVLDHDENDPFSMKEAGAEDSQEGMSRNPFRESLASSRIFNPFSAKTKDVAKYSGKTRHDLYIQQKESKEIDDWLKKIKKRRLIASMDPFLIPKVTSKPQKPRYRVAIMGSRGSGRRTLFTQLKRLAEDPDLDSEIFGCVAVVPFANFSYDTYFRMVTDRRVAPRLSLRMCYLELFHSFE